MHNENNQEGECSSGNINVLVNVEFTTAQSVSFVENVLRH